MGFDASEISGAVTEIVAYGTAAVIAPTHSDELPLQ